VQVAQLLQLMHALRAHNECLLPMPAFGYVPFLIHAISECISELSVPSPTPCLPASDACMTQSEVAAAECGPAADWPSESQIMGRQPAPYACCMMHAVASDHT
jgi:hypothetical protein